MMVAVAAMALPAVASADTEPNNSLPTAEGIVAGTSYSGTVPVEDEFDLYFFYAPGATELKISTAPGSGCDAFHLETALALSHPLVTIEPNAEVGPTTDATFVTPVGAPQIYYFRVVGACKGNYQFGITSSLPFHAWPNPWGNRQPAPEPNESAAEAQGPLVGGVTYEGSKTTVNDEDWFYFYAHASRLITVSMTNPAPEDGCYEAIVGQDSEDLQVNVDGGSATRYGKATLQTAAGPIRKYFIKVLCPEGETYLFNVNPPEALSSVAAAGVPRTCTEARAQRRRLSRRLARAIHNRHRAKAKRAKRKAKRAIRKLRPRFRKAHKRMVRAC